MTASDPAVRPLLQAYLDAVGLSEGVQSRIWKTAELTLGQLRVLRRLAQAPKSLGEVGAELSLSPTSVTRLIDRLEERGLVERRRDQGDRRRVEAALLPKGQELIAGLPVLGGTPIWEAAHRLTPRQRESIAAALRDFVQAVREVEEEQQIREPVAAPR